mgnify:CR=1 FL=1
MCLRSSSVILRLVRRIQIDVSNGISSLVLFTNLDTYDYALIFSAIANFGLKVNLTVILSQSKNEPGNFRLPGSFLNKKSVYPPILMV